MALKRHDHIGEWLQLIFSILVLLIPSLLFPVCNGEAELISGVTMPMRCHYLKMSAVGIGVLQTIVAFIRLFVLDFVAKQCLMLVQMAQGAVLMLLPYVLIGACTNPGMPCRIGTSPALVIAGALCTIFAFTDFLTAKLR